MTMKNDYLQFDLMQLLGGGNERFIATMRYPHSPIFKLNIKGLYEWICDKRPSLKSKPLSLYFDDKGKTALYFNQDVNKIAKYL